MINFLVVGGDREKREKKIWQIAEKYKPEKLENDPDIFILEAEKTNIEEVRNLKHWLSLKPYNQPPKVIIVLEIQNLTSEVQIILGGLLEKPQEAIVILSSPHPEQLLANIVSRCQLMSLPPQPEMALSGKEIKKYQEELEGILKSRVGERIKLTEKIKSREEAEKFCQIQLILWREMFLVNPSFQNLKTLREIQKTLRYLSTNVNPRLALDNLLLSYPKPQ